MDARPLSIENPISNGLDEGGGDDSTKTVVSDVTYNGSGGGRVGIVEAGDACSGEGGGLGDGGLGDGGGGYSPDTSTGVLRSVKVPSPSWP